MKPTVGIMKTTKDIPPQVESSVKAASAKIIEKSWKAGHNTAEQLCEMLNGFKTNTINKVHALSKIDAAVHLDGEVE